MHSSSRHRESVLHRATTVKLDPEDEWREALINAGIMAGLAFFTTLAGIGATGLTQEPALALAALGISAGLAFFTRLALERGIKKG